MGFLRVDDNVVSLRPAENPDVVLEEAKGQYESVFILGYSLEDGSMDARASLNLDPVDINWLISMFQSKLLNGDYA